MQSRSHSFGLKPGKDVAVVANDDLPFLESMDPPVTSVSNNPKVAARMTFGTLENVLRNNPARENQYIPLKLVERATSCAPGF